MARNEPAYNIIHGVDGKRRWSLWLTTLDESLALIGRGAEEILKLDQL
ncbi:hypothetical protein GFB77_20945, partial [Acinetobacter baumannii]|nr:hypothetical protein [Acinetobacter baumannii]